MRGDSGATNSVWRAPTEIERPRQLDRDVSADVCVVGAGIAGLSTAYLLTREGHSVVVLEDGSPGGGETGRTTTHLAVPDDGFAELARLHGDEGARRAVQSHLDAIDRIEAIVREEHVACDFERLDGYLFAPPAGGSRDLEEELAVANRLGFREIEKVARAPIDEFDTGVALRFPRQGQFQPLRYLAGLAQPRAHISAASSSGTRRRRAGTARAMGRASRPRAGW